MYIDYSHAMKNKKLHIKAGTAGFVLNALLLFTLTGCTSYVDRPRAGIYVAPPVVEVAAPADYIYYPGYDVYFNSNLRQFTYMDGGVWVSRPSFPGVSVDVLLASPSVRMDFHDSPANHHTEMARAYPRNWTPSGENHVQRSEVQKPEVQKAHVDKAPEKKAPAQKANQKPDKRDEHEGK
jgi:hypothetical protein